MRLPFDANQATFDEWRAFFEARVEDPADDFMAVDLNDMIVVFATAKVIGQDHPELLEKLREYTPEAVERAGKDLGIFMGIGWLADQIGFDAEEARKNVFHVLK